jgi:hypothetical protein
VANSNRKQLGSLEDQDKRSQRSQEISQMFCPYFCFSRKDKDRHKPKEEKKGGRSEFKNLTRAHYRLGVDISFSGVG